MNIIEDGEDHDDVGNEVWLSIEFVLHFTWYIYVKHGIYVAQVQVFIKHPSKIPVI